MYILKHIQKPIETQSIKAMCALQKTRIEENEEMHRVCAPWKLQSNWEVCTHETKTVQSHLKDLTVEFFAQLYIRATGELLGNRVNFVPL